MIIIGTRVSWKCGELISNPREEQFRKVQDRKWGNAIDAVGEKKHDLQFDDGTQKYAHSNHLKIEPSTAGLPLNESSNEESHESSQGSNASNES